MTGAEQSWTRIHCDIDFDRDGKQVSYLQVPHSRNDSAWGVVRIPIMVIKNGDGPGTLLTGGVHGDEYEGPIALAELARTLTVEAVSGRVIIIPSLHYPACVAGARVSPIDGRDLNRSFPGDAAGSFAQMLAHFVRHRLLPLVSTNIDLHSGGRSLDCMPCTMSHLLDDAATLTRTRALASAFGAPLHVMNREVDGAFTFQSTAEQLGVISLSSELGGSGRVSLEGLEIARRGLRRALAHLGNIDAVLAPLQTPTRFMEIAAATDYGFAPVSGIYGPRIPLGATVEPGQVLGEIHSMDDPWQEPIPVLASRSGMLWCQRGQGLISAGDASAVVVAEWMEGQS